jgi:predicted membrane protein
LVLGLLIIAAGIILLLDRIAPEMAVNFATYWPALLIVMGIGNILQYSDFRNLMSGGILVLVGVIFQLDRLHIFYLKDIWPIALIILGIAIVIGGFWRPMVCCGPIFHRHRHRRVLFGSTEGNNSDFNSDTLNLSTVLGEGKYHVTSKAFKGGDVSTVMGGVELDLRDAEIENDKASITVSAVMGSVEIWLPPNWEIVLKGTPILGSIENRTRASNDTTKKIFIDASAVMGSIELRN